MEQLWSMSTTLREAERVIGFAKTANEMENEEWTRENQMKYQILLIKNRFYLSPDNTQSLNGLNPVQVAILSNREHELTYEEAEGIFLNKNYQDPPMRGRQSMSPLKKLGLVYIENNRIKITDLCRKLISNNISLEQFMFDSLLKYQYPNPMERGYQEWNTKPFINTLRLIKRVNELTIEGGGNPKGISKTEFGIFVLSFKDYRHLDRVATEILRFRNEYMSLPQAQRENFALNYIDRYLHDFNNPRNNCSEYTDNMLRYLRLTKYIHLRGKYTYTYIDLEPRRMKEIDSILESDDGSSSTYTTEEWYSYIGTYGTYDLPYETVEKLSDIAQDIVKENNTIRNKLSIEKVDIQVNEDKDALKELIVKLRNERTQLQNLEIKYDYHTNTDMIDEAIASLNDILARNRARLAKKFSIELEKWANIALNIINDAVLIKPNTKVGDDNEPIFTAPAGVADIECFYNSFSSICEVTMLVGRDQWYNEGQPVMRHLRDFENNSKNGNVFCLFIAPSLHVDTLNTFLLATKYQYNGERQKIVPITINQLISILDKVKEKIVAGDKMSHLELEQLFLNCCNLAEINTIDEWKDQISVELDAF